MQITNKQQIQYLDFFLKFPELKNILAQFKQNHFQSQSNINKFITIDIYNQIDEIFLKEFHPFWKKLKQTFDGNVNKHIIRVIFLSYNNKKFQELDQEQQNICLWCCILHDIVKRTIPVIKSSKDPFHPYLSAIAVLDYFEKKTFFNEKQKQIKDKLQQTQKNSKYTQNIYGQQFETICYKSLNEILQMTDSILISEFSNTVYKVTAFHQSLTVIEEFPNFSVLHPSELYKVFSKRQLQILELLMISDSQSYIASKKKQKQVESEIEKNFQMYEEIAKLEKISNNQVQTLSAKLHRQQSQKIQNTIHSAIKVLIFNIYKISFPKLKFTNEQNITIHLRLKIAQKFQLFIYPFSF